MPDSGADYVIRCYVDHLAGGSPHQLDRRGDCIYCWPARTGLVEAGWDDVRIDTEVARARERLHARPS